MNRFCSLVSMSDVTKLAIRERGTLETEYGIQYTVVIRKTTVNSSINEEIDDDEVSETLQTGSRVSVSAGKNTV